MLKETAFLALSGLIVSSALIGATTAFEGECCRSFQSETATGAPVTAENYTEFAAVRAPTSRDNRKINDEK